MQFIKRSEAVRQIYSGECFDMQFITADLKRGTGGELIEVINWQILKKDDEPGAASGSTAGSRTPNNDEHQTITIHNPGNSRVHPISVHIKLIQFFNGKRILNG
jgi:hypothetical protein